MKDTARRLTAVIGAASLIPTVIAAVFIWRSGLSLQWRVASVAALVLLSLGSVAYVGSRTKYRLRTLSNLIAALREGDFGLPLQFNNFRD